MLSKPEMPSNEHCKVSVIFMSFNHASFVGESVRALLNQTSPPDELILSDDSSSDNTFELIKAEVAGYTGPTRLILNKNQSNLGVVKHVNYLMTLVTGELILVASADDVSYATRVEESRKDWVLLGRPHLLFYNMEMIYEGKCERKTFPVNVDSLRPGWMLRNINSTVLAPGMAWSRDVFTVFGPLPADVRTEEKPIAFRAALLGGVIYRETILVKYRIHENNLSNAIRKRKLTKRENKKHLLEIYERRLAGFSQDLNKAIGLGIIEGQQSNELALALKAGQFFLYHRRRILCGTWWQAIFSRLSLAMNNSVKKSFNDSCGTLGIF